MRASGAEFNEAALTRYGLPACSCHRYVHYCVCDHAIAMMLDKGILDKIPPKLNPAGTKRTALASITYAKKGAGAGSKAGRIRKSRKGGARERDSESDESPEVQRKRRRKSKSAKRS